MSSYQHSVSLNVEKCKGCTHCLKRCPTEAIRIRDGHAQINAARCIDCGECIRVCPHKAKKAVYDKLSDIPEGKWKIALPAPSLFGQFDNLDDIDYVLQGLLDMGFDEVYEVARAAEIVSDYTRRFMKQSGVSRPVISSACPVITRLISLRYPFLTDNLLPLLPPMEIAAKEAREAALKKHPELKDEDIGVCFISPCPAKVSYVNNGFADMKSKVDVVVSIRDIYFMLINVMKRNKTPEALCESGMIGIGWATSGGEATAILNDNYLAADGIDNISRVLDEIENGNIPSLEFIELNACSGGCVGGVMAVENPFIAKARMQSLRRYLPVSQNFISKDDGYIPENYFFNDLPAYNPITRLSDNLGESMRMMADIQRIREDLPGIDCGSCGAPTCRAFAEDIVKGDARPSGCIISMKKQLEEYLEQNK